MSHFINYRLISFFSFGFADAMKLVTTYLL